MGLFSSSKSRIENKTENNVTNNQVAAGSDGFAVGAGAKVTIENSDADVARSAITESGRVARDALDFSEDVVRDQSRFASDVTENTFDFSEDVVDRVSGLSEEALDLAGDSVEEGFGFGRDALDFTDTILDAQLEANERARSENLNFARASQELTAAQAGVVPPASNDKLIGAVIVAVIATTAAPIIRGFFKS